MVTQAAPLLLTVEQFREAPASESLLQELHWGQVVQLTRPKARHVKLQSQLVRLLRPIAEPLGFYVESELPFRALPEYDLRAADVACVSSPRWDLTDDAGDLQGSPEIVIEVLSPSNKGGKIRELATLCFASRTVEFWVIDPKEKTVSVTRPNGATSIYSESDTMPLALFPGAPDLPVASIFEPCPAI